jgi:hypothetical protein
MAPPVHPDLAELSFLLGTWRGSGRGEWPGVDDFTYGEELAFEHVGDAFLLYAQRSWTLEGEEPIHFERGFWRPGGPGRVEVVLAHPLGIGEVAEGTVRDGAIDVSSTAVTLTATASAATELHRRLEVAGDELTYELDMAMREIPRQFHVRSRLERVGA